MLVFALVRTVCYATLFIAFVLVFLPARLVTWSGVAKPAAMGVAQVMGMLMAGLGGALALWCVFAFALLGKGTPAPFDPPRRLVVRGPYKFVRNPMYLGATIALGGAALFYKSAALAGYTGAFFLIAHVFVMSYEEPTLQAVFGSEYDDYRSRVKRWWPGLKALAARR